jgi:transcription elongation GreA/GreB family factor
MAIDATPMEVWIEWRTRPRAAVVVPYVRGQDKALIDYQVLIRRQGTSGSTEIQQTGDAQLEPSIAKPLGELLISREPGDSCTVYVKIGERGRPGQAKPLERNFNCPLVR